MTTVILPSALPPELLTEVSYLAQKQTQSKQKHLNSSRDSLKFR